jgi:hypothetical protein
MENVNGRRFRIFSLLGNETNTYTSHVEDLRCLDSCAG